MLVSLNVLATFEIGAELDPELYMMMFLTIGHLSKVVIRAERRSRWMVCASASVVGIGMYESRGLFFSLLPFQFLVVLATMLASTIPVSILGLRFAMDIDPFCNPGQYR